MVNEGAREDMTDPLRLAVVDTEDLAVVSAHLQDAEAQLNEMAYLPGTKRFALVVARFDWPKALQGRFERCRTGLHFERVLNVARSGIDSTDGGTLNHLLAISFVPEDPPAGSVLLTFAGGGRIRLTVECLEAELRDLGPRWPVESRPGHGFEDARPARRD